MRPLDAADPARIGEYRLLGVLGAGGMGRVYLGRNAGGRTVAVKVIRPDLVGDNEFRVRFGREVAAARRVGGAFTAPVLDADVEANPPWLATGYVAGFSLAEAVETYGPFAENALLVLAHGLAEALLAVHAAGLVHRDLKPSNVLLALDGPKVIDFGIARAIEDSRLTTTGKVIGSPGFMCPEQVTGATFGPAGDVFALGGVLVFAATGQGPFGAGEMVQMLWRVVYEEPYLDGVPERLRPLIAACLTKDPAGRPTPHQLRAALTEIAPPTRAGWLPGPALEEVSRRAVALLDLDSGPFDVPHALTATDTDRAAETVVCPATEPHAATGTGGSTTEHDVTVRSPWQGGPGAGPQAAGPAYHLGPQHNSSPPSDAHRPADTAPRTPRRTGHRRPVLIAAVVVICLAVALGAFAITSYVTRDRAETTTTAADTPAEPGAELPGEYIGEWKGAAKDTLGTYDIVLTLYAGTVGDQVGESTNTGRVAGLSCGRTETLTAVEPDKITLSAQLSGDSGLCNDEGATTELTVHPDGSLSYRTRGVLGDMEGTLTKTP